MKKIFGEKEVNSEAVLQRLDRLTFDEARTTAAQTLKVVHGLVQSMTIVMDGEYILVACGLLFDEFYFLLDGKASFSTVRQALGTFVSNKPVPYLTKL